MLLVRGARFILSMDIKGCSLFWKVGKKWWIVDRRGLFSFLLLFYFRGTGSFSVIHILTPSLPLSFVPTFHIQIKWLVWLLNLWMIPNWFYTTSNFCAERKLPWLKGAFHDSRLLVDVKGSHGKGLEKADWSHYCKAQSPIMTHAENCRCTYLVSPFPPRNCGEMREGQTEKLFFSGGGISPSTMGEGCRISDSSWLPWCHCMSLTCCDGLELPLSLLSSHYGSSLRCWGWLSWKRKHK